MSNLVSTVWLEIKGSNKKVLICAIYREFNDLTGEGQMSIDKQIERWKIFHSQVEQAKKEGSEVVSNEHLEKILPQFLLDFA